MNKKQEPCCEKCEKRVRDRSFIGSGSSRRSMTGVHVECKKPTCPCHTPSAPTVEGEKLYAFRSNKKCELFIDHRPDWCGDCYACSVCGLRFYSAEALSHSRIQVIEEIEAGINNFTKYGTTKHTGNKWAYLETEIRQLLTQLKKGEIKS